MLNNTLIRSIAREVKKNHRNRKWRKLNHHNQTVLNDCKKMESVMVGKYSYGEINVITFDDKHRLIIKDYVSIAPNTYFILDAEHCIDTISTYPYKVNMCKKKNEAFGKGNIVVDSDAWIGYGATIMSGVHIGQGAVVAAGAVVAKDVPPYAVVGGAPAKIIKYRFSEPVRDFLISLDYSSLTETMIVDNIEALYTPIENEGTSAVEKLFEWFPKK